MLVMLDELVNIGFSPQITTFNKQLKLYIINGNNYDLLLQDMLNGAYTTVAILPKDDLKMRASILLAAENLIESILKI